MKENRDKQHYRELRQRSREDLWTLVQRGDREPALIRAVGVAFANTETEKARKWVRGLFRHTDEKIRRYAINAWPKLDGDEEELLHLLEKNELAREKEALRDALEKIGGAAALKKIGSQKLKAKLTGPGKIRFDHVFQSECRINLRCRSGLEEILKQEIESHKKFRILQVRQALVTITAKNFSLADIFELRCFAIAGFALPSQKNLADTICAGAKILETFTEGPPTYRLDFIREGHRRAAVKQLATEIYSRCPTLLNSPSQSLWTIAIFKGQVELRPRLVPDPRFIYRADDVAASSHPPLAAAMARLAGPQQNEIAWDPFCGAGLELIERARLGGVKKIVGTDLSPEAIEITKKNFTAASTLCRNRREEILTSSEFHQTDFRQAPDFDPTLIITNPPLGKRVPIPNLNELFRDLFARAAQDLPKGGRLVLVNPTNLTAPGLKRVFNQTIDMGGFNCRLEKYVK